MTNTISKFSNRFKLGKVTALGYGVGLFGVVAFFALPYLAPNIDPTMRPTIGAVVGLIVGSLVAIIGGSLIKKN